MTIEGFTVDQIAALAEMWQLGTPVDVTAFLERRDIPEDSKTNVRKAGELRTGMSGASQARAYGQMQVAVLREVARLDKKLWNPLGERGLKWLESSSHVAKTPRNSPCVRLLERPSSDEEMHMSENDVSTHAGATVTVTAKGRVALAADALVAAAKTRSEQRRKRLCEEALSHLRSVVQG